MVHLRKNANVLIKCDTLTSQQLKALEKLITFCSYDIVSKAVDITFEIDKSGIFTNLVNLLKSTNISIYLKTYNITSDLKKQLRFPFIIGKSGKAVEHKCVTISTTDVGYNDHMIKFKFKYIDLLQDQIINEDSWRESI